MTAQRWFRASMVLALWLAARLSNAQVLTGTFSGTVKDESGGVLPAASVHLSSPALISGPISMVANERGQFRFVSLAAGDYALDVDMPGFAAYHEDQISIVVQRGSLPAISTYATRTVSPAPIRCSLAARSTTKYLAK